MKENKFKIMSSKESLDSTPNQRTNTDSEPIVTVRIQNELNTDFEPTYGRDLKNRLSLVRALAFTGVPDVKGDNPLSYRGILVRSGSLFYPKPESVTPLLEKYAELVDELYSEINKMKDESGHIDIEYLWRFISIVYFFGIQIHPYIDGNGQTFRMLVLSYLNEFGIFPNRSVGKVYYHPHTVAAEIILEERKKYFQSNPSLRLALSIYKRRPTQPTCLKEQELIGSYS